jgi:hypothetical protein
MSWQALIILQADVKGTLQTLRVFLQHHHVTLAAFRLTYANNSSIKRNINFFVPLLDSSQLIILIFSTVFYMALLTLDNLLQTFLVTCLS